MFSDDDTPLSSQPSTARGPQNGHVAQNGNGRPQADSSMSEDDDVPLVCSSLYMPCCGDYLTRADTVSNHSHEVRACDPGHPPTQTQEAGVERVVQ